MTKDELIIDEMIIILMKAAKISYQDAADQVENLMENIANEVDIIRMKRNA